MVSVSDKSFRPCDDSVQRVSLMLIACLAPMLIAAFLTMLFSLVGDYKVVVRVPASTEFASINFPVKGNAVGSEFVVSGSIGELPKDQVAYLMVKRGSLYWPKKYLGASIGEWSQEIIENKQKDSVLSIVVLMLSHFDKLQIDEWYVRANKTGKYPGINNLQSAKEIALVEVTQK